MGSGPGSFSEYNSKFLELLQNLIRDKNIKSIVDFGCGDWQLMNLMDFRGIDYIGFDVVPKLIDQNKKKSNCTSRDAVGTDNGYRTCILKSIFG